MGEEGARIRLDLKEHRSRGGGRGGLTSHHPAQEGVAFVQKYQNSTCARVRWGREAHALPPLNQSPRSPLPFEFPLSLPLPPRLGGAEASSAPLPP